MHAALDFLASLPPALWALALVALGAAVNSLGRRAAARWPAIDPYVRAALDALPNVLGAIDTLVQLRRLDPPPPPPPSPPRWPGPSVPPAPPRDAAMRLSLAFVAGALGCRPPSARC